jgi:hypothetical protein
MPHSLRSCAPRLRACLAAATVLLAICACHGSTSNNCGCPAGANGVQIQLLCPLVEVPVIQTTGPCSAFQSGADTISFLFNGPKTVGTCQVTLAFANGSMASVTIQSSLEWFACGSDPHGCGQLLIVTPSEPTVDTCFDSGVDAAATEQ